MKLDLVHAPRVYIVDSPGIPSGPNSLGGAAYMWQRFATQFAVGVAEGLIMSAPELVEAGKSLYDRARGRKRERVPDMTADTVPLRPDTVLAELQERVYALESSEEAQAELIARMTDYQKTQAGVVAQVTRNQAALVRWGLVLALAVIFIGGVAVAALVVALLG